MLAHDVRESERTKLEMNKEDDLLEDLRRVDKVVKEVLISSEELFSVVNKGDGLRLKVSRLGKKLISVLKVSEIEFSHHFPMHDMSPYADLLFRCAARSEDPYLPFIIDGLCSDEFSWAVSILNDLVFDIRESSTSHNFKSTIRRFNKASKKRSDSLSRYVEALFSKYSRLVVIRVDLSYGSREFEGVDLLDAVKKAKDDWSRMQKDLYKGVPVGGLVGFACKLEYGHLKGLHFHLLAFYDGSRCRKDVVMAKLLGVHWAEVITKGSGRYHNCNKNKAHYTRLGIGIINHYDVELIKNLKLYVSEYLVKVDYFVRLVPETGRVFFRGNMPKPKIPGRGRPRRVLEKLESN